MYGALLGDYIGSPYEFDRGDKTKDFPLFSDMCEFTDDSVMTIAVADAMMATRGESDEAIKRMLVRSMLRWGRRFLWAGYGHQFMLWLQEDDPQPYGSYGNGSAMRVSSVGWLFDTLEETRRHARLSAEVSHNHPEGIKGAEATASAIFLARTGASKDEIRDYIVTEFGYDLSRTCDEIRPTYYHRESCQETVPEAITAFLEGQDFEDVIRTAVSLGGDCDTLTCIAGSMAEAFYGVPEDLIKKVRDEVPEEMLKVLDRFDRFRYTNALKMLSSMGLSADSEGTLVSEKLAGPGLMADSDLFDNTELMSDSDLLDDPEWLSDLELPDDPFLEGNVMIESMIARYHEDDNEDNLRAVVEMIRVQMQMDGHFLLPVLMERGEQTKFQFKTLRMEDDQDWAVAYTSWDELQKGPKSEVLSCFIDQALKMCKGMDVPGIVINPFGQPFALTKELIEFIFMEEEEFARDRTKGSANVYGEGFLDE